MKKPLLFFLLFGLLNSACKKSEEVQQTEQHDVTFSLTDYAVTVGDLKSSAGKVSADSLKNAADYLYCRIYSGTSGLLVNSVDQTKATAGENFGKITLQMPTGNHKAIFVASKRPLTWRESTGRTISNDFFSSVGQPYDTFFKRIDNINVTADATFDVSLDRIVAGLDLILEDGIPANVNSVAIIVQQDATSMYVATGQKFDFADRASSFIFTAADKGTPNKLLSSYVFMGHGTFNVLLRAYGDFGGDTFADRIIQNVPFNTNRKTIIKGRLFNTSSSASFVVTANANWDTPNLPVIPFN